VFSITIKKGIVTCKISNFFEVLVDGEIFHCKASKKLTGKNHKILVGDRVNFDFDKLYIIEIDDRRNELVRPSIANIDIAFLVFSVIDPTFSQPLLDRFLALIIKNNIQPIIILTKIDNADAQEIATIEKTLQYYKAIGVPYLLKKDNYQAEMALLVKNKTAIFTGQTGVGKSTLMNELDPKLNI